MDVKELADVKRILDAIICQAIREFEWKTGMVVVGIKINRDEQGIENVVVKVEMPD